MRCFDTDTMILALLLFLLVVSVLSAFASTEKEEWRDTTIEFRNGKLVEIEKDTIKELKKYAEA